ncbi:MAG: NAD(P)-dependent oxidoreductase [Flammeovirgaceae bacterium]|nr:MAG: NAD(P)-dependent oxidoreductase [Flammeovirgaceae bacterium]
MKILVTGCNGLLGQKLVKKLCSDNAFKVIATARAAGNALPADTPFYQLDITRPAQVNEVITGTRPDIVINTAAATNVDWCEQNQEACTLVNTTAVQYLVEACNKTGSHFIQLSTDFIFDGTKALLTEEDKPGPINHYGLTKLQAEQHIQRQSASWCIIRTVIVYGVASGINRSNIVLWVKSSLEAGNPIRVVNDQWRTPTLAEDLALGCYLAAKKKATGIFHISGKDFLTPYDIAIRTADFFGLNKSLISPTTSEVFQQPARRPLKTGFSIEKANRRLGYSPHSFEQGLAIIKTQLQS